MQATRRRKKRPNYGVRSVEVERGVSGFGFTISGQAPCLLSCVVSGSPAERAGLRPGDYLLAVDGQSVACSLHDDVVRMIGACMGTLRLQIAPENCVTDSSEDEAALLVTRVGAGVAGRHHRPPRHRYDATAAAAGPGGASSSRRASTGGTYTPTAALRGDPLMPPPAAACRSAARLSVAADRAVNGLLYTGLQEQQQRERRLRQQRPAVADGENVRLRAVVGYLGTIEMPKHKESPDGSRLPAIRSCIRRLRVEKKVHTLTLLSVMRDSVLLSNAHGLPLADYPADCITFCGVYADDKRFFGLVTARRECSDDSGAAAASSDRSRDVRDAPAMGAEAAGGAVKAASSSKPLSSSCHVFMVDPRLSHHIEHARRARAFGLQCTRAADGPGGALCAEFPSTAEPVLRAILSLYRNRQLPGVGQQQADPLVAGPAAPHSPGASSGSNSSNSDSGIGFRDDINNTAERIFVVDVERERSRLQRVPPPGAVMGPPPPPPPSLQAAQSAAVLQSGGGRRRQSRGAGARSTRAVASRATNMLSSHGALVRSMEDLRFSGVRHQRSRSATTLDSDSVCEEPSAVAMCVADGYGGDASGSDSADVTAGRVPAWQRRHRMLSDGEATRFVLALDPHQDEVRTDPGHRSLPRCGPHEHADYHRQLSADNADSAPESCHYQQQPSNGYSRRFTAQQSPRPARSTPRDTRHAKIAAGGRSACSSNMLPRARSADAVPRTGRVVSWSNSFDQLLQDPAGLHTFSEFLKGQFSHENIYFWVGCERYKQLPAERRAAAAQQLYERHLCDGAPEPVNIDSQAHQSTQDALHQADVSLFHVAQEQIYKLMRLDCYPRFLKSSIYEDCVFLEASGEPLPYLGDDKMDPDLNRSVTAALPASTKKKSGKNRPEERRRKSLLPWSRAKDRSKSKDRSEVEQQGCVKKQPTRGDDSGSLRSDLSGSHTSLASAGAAGGDITTLLTASKESVDSCGAAADGRRCRVLLPDSSWAVVQTSSAVSVRALLQRLVERRALAYRSWDVYLVNEGSASERPLNQALDSSALNGRQIRMEQRVLFRLSLPNHKAIGVKAKPNRRVRDVLQPILTKYGLALDACVVAETGGSGADVGPAEPLDLGSPVTTLDNQSLSVRLRGAVEPQPSAVSASLDEITNRVFHELLRAKTDAAFDELGILEMDGGVTAKLERHQASSWRSARRPQMSAAEQTTSSCYRPPAAVSHRHSMPVQRHNSGLFEGLKRAQLCRLDNERGTEINFELPEFLSGGGKENWRPPGSTGRIPTHEQAEGYFGRAEERCDGRVSIGMTGTLQCSAMPPLTPRRLADLDETLTPPPPPPQHAASVTSPPDFTPPAPLVATHRPASALLVTSPPPPLPPKPRLSLRAVPPPRPPAAGSECLTAGRSRHAIYIDKPDNLSISFV